ncbi:MAG TPA: hypothetical protein VK177_17955 [Flavobacteriales bacterium]|nr:hypothetical protein [Flavobacteriales bacterium]
MTGVGDKIISFTNLYFNEYSKQAKEGNLVFDDEHETFVFYLLDKIVETYAGVGELLKLSERNNGFYLKNSVYILVRANLSDAIIACWLFDNTDPNEQDDDAIKRKTEELRRDHIRFHLSYLKKMESLGLLPAKEKKNELQIINTNYRHLIPNEIKADLNIKGLPKATSITDMLKENNKHLKTLVEAYKNYFLLSKIEHTGEFTRMILEKTYENGNPMDDYLSNSILVIESTIKVLVPLFFKDQEFLKRIKSFSIIK